MARDYTGMRPWVKKFDDGEYLREWRGYANLAIGENKYFHCVGEFNGIGDVSWWIEAEMSKLTDEQCAEVEAICAYKKYVKETIRSKTNYLAWKFSCESFHVSRLGDKTILEMLDTFENYRNKILKRSSGCYDPKTIEFREQKSSFFIESFDEFKKRGGYEDLMNSYKSKVITPETFKKEALQMIEFYEGNVPKERNWKLQCIEFWNTIDVDEIHWDTIYYKALTLENDIK